MTQFRFTLNVALSTLYFFAALGSSRYLFAQALPTVKGPGSYVAVGAGASLFHFEYGDRLLGGVMVYSDINPTWRFGIEGEVRSLRYHASEDVTEITYLAGPRVAISSGRVRPYLKLLAGMGHYNLPFRYAEGNFLTYSPGAGVDVAINDVVSVRVIDFEYQLTENFHALSNGPYTQLENAGLSAGLQIRLTPVSRFPEVFRYRKRAYGR